MSCLSWSQLEVPCAPGRRGRCKWTLPSFKGVTGWKRKIKPGCVGDAAVLQAAKRMLPGLMLPLSHEWGQLCSAGRYSSLWGVGGCSIFHSDNLYRKLFLIQRERERGNDVIWHCARCSTAFLAGDVITVCDCGSVIPSPYYCTYMSSCRKIKVTLIWLPWLYKSRALEYLSHCMLILYTLLVLRRHVCLYSCHCLTC